MEAGRRTRTNRRRALIASAGLNAALVVALLVAAGRPGAVPANAGGEGPASAAAPGSLEAGAGHAPPSESSERGGAAQEDQHTALRPEDKPVRDASLQAPEEPSSADTEVFRTLASCVEAEEADLDIVATMQIDEAGRPDGIDVLRGTTTEAEEACVSARLEAIVYEHSGPETYYTVHLGEGGMVSTYRSGVPPLHEEHLAWPGVSRSAIAQSCRTRSDWRCVERMLEGEAELESQDRQLLLQASLNLHHLDAVRRGLGTIPSEEQTSSALVPYQALLYRLDRGLPVGRVQSSGPGFPF